MDTQAAGLLTELEGIRARANALMDRVAGDEAFGWQPDAGRGWSVGQCLDHLTQTNRLYVAGIRDALAGMPRSATPVLAPIRSSWFGRKFAASMEPGKGRYRSPGKVIPRSATNRAQVWTEFQRELDEIEALIKDGATIDLNRAALPNPFVGVVRMRAGTAFRVLLAHMRRHLQQGENVIARRRA